MEGKLRLKKADLWLMAGLFVLAGGLLLWQLLSRKAGAVLEIRVDGVLTASYPLSEDRELTLTGEKGTYNRVVIRDGEAYMEQASCPDKLCVKMSHIRYAGESITCLPNRTVLIIEGGTPSGVDIH